MLDSNQHRRFWRPPCYRLHQCHIPDLVNVQVGKTVGMVEWFLPPTARNVYVYMHPFGRASPSVINRLIKAGSLLSPTCSSGDIRAIPSVTQAATPMKPRANLGNRTRQPKGCASRIAKPARLDRTSQNHLMMIILNKTGATTVAQLDFETPVIHTQSETRGCRRHVLCANFSKTRALFLLLSHRPQQKGRAGGSPTGGVCCVVQRWDVCTIVFWRVVWYRAGTFLCMRSWPCMSWPRRGCGCVASVVAVAVSPWASQPPCRAVAVVSVVFSSPSCGCDTPTNASVCSGLCGVYVDSICTTYVGRV